jgi:integrase
VSYLSTSRFRVEPVPPSDVEVLRARLRPEFLTDAGWLADELILFPPDRHPLLGRAKCAVVDCAASVRNLDRGLCSACRERFKGSGLDLAAFVRVRSGKRNRGERFCRVGDCGRPAHQRSGLCTGHQYRFQKHGAATVESWIATAKPEGLPSFGGCRVLSCPRVAAAANLLCLAHGQRWSELRRSGSLPDFEEWLRGQEPADTGRMVVLKGLPDDVIVEILVGLQWRCDDHTKTSMGVLRAMVRLARQRQVQSLSELLGARLSWQKEDLAALVRAMTMAVRRSLTSPELEQRRDRWDLALFGGRGRIDFTVIAQPWLREAAKHWVLEDLPLHRGRQAPATAKHTVRAIGHLSWSLQHGRTDHGLVLPQLGRADIVGFTNRLAYMERTQKISTGVRYVVCVQVRKFLTDIRAFGLTRPGQPLAGLPEDFAVRPGDIPSHPDRRGVSRDLPASVLRTITEHLPLLEKHAGVEVRRIVEILIDTGRRPEEVCQLPWDCLRTSADGKQVLIYTDSKNNRPNQRLPLSDETAQLIRGYRDDVSRRFPRTPIGQLALFPRRLRNPAGTVHVAPHRVSCAHRQFISVIADQLRDEAGQPFPPSAVVPYAYRHSFAQRHADHGSPPDVLRDLMGHTSMRMTLAYYRVTEKRVRRAVDQVALHQYDAQGRRVFAEIAGLVTDEHARIRVGQVAVPFGICTEPTNVKAGGQACPYKFTCLGCGHFRSDASYLPELKSYLQQLLADRERILAATDIQDWARAQAAPSSEEISRLRQLIRRVEDELDQLTPDDQHRIRDAISVIRNARQTVSLGMPSIRSTARQTP